METLFLREAPSLCLLSLKVNSLWQPLGLRALSGVKEYWSNNEITVIIAPKLREPRHLLQIVWEIAQILHRFQQDGYRVAMHLPAARIDQGAFRRRQEEVLDEFLMRIRRFEMRIVTVHTHLAAVQTKRLPL
jgi:hypothetical protein